MLTVGKVGHSDAGTVSAHLWLELNQGPFPALMRHLGLEDGPVPVLPDAFLGPCAPRLLKIHLGGISFPAAPTLILSARDLVEVDLHDIPKTGYISPEVMVTSLAALSRLKYLYPLVPNGAFLS